MSDQPLQLVEAVTEALAHRDQIDEYVRVRQFAEAGAPLNTKDLAVLLRLSVNRVYRLAKAGAFRNLTLADPIGPRIYCGRKVVRRLDGERETAPTWGARRARG